MTTPNDDMSSPRPDAEARLSGADPAVGAPDPDIERIRSRVMASTQVVPLEHARRRHRGLLVAGSIAAGVVLLAGVALSGAAVGRVTAPSGEVVAASADTGETIPVVGGGSSPQLPTVQGAPAPAPGPAGGAATSEAKSMVYPGYGAFLEPDASLADDSGTAPGYRFDGSEVDHRALAAQLAKALGVPGKPRNMDGAWMVGPEDYSAPVIWVAEDGMVSWSYTDPTQNPWACAEPAPGGATPEPAPAPDEAQPMAPAESDTSVSGSAGGSTSTDPGVPEQCSAPTKAMPEREALRAAREILTAIGVTESGPQGVDVEWETGSDGVTTWATAWQRVDGSRTQLSWNFTFGEKDPIWASGFAAGLEQIPGYPIVGARTAVERSQSLRWTSFGPTPLDFGGVVPMAEARSGSVASSDVATSSSVSGGAPAQDVPEGVPGKVQVWWDPVTVIGAEPTLVQYWQPDGSLLLLPAYRLATADDRGTWAVIAVADSAIDWIAPETAVTPAPAE